jgi:hypothetical protein
MDTNSLIQQIAVGSAVLILVLSLMQQNGPSILGQLATTFEKSVQNAVNKAHVSASTHPAISTPTAAATVTLQPQNSLVPPPPAI